MTNRSDDPKADEFVERLEAAAGEHGLVVSVLGEVDTATAARLIGCAPHTLENQRVLGGGPEFVRRGGRVRYTLRALADWLLR